MSLLLTVIDNYPKSGQKNLAGAGLAKTGLMPDLPEPKSGTSLETTH